MAEATIPIVMSLSPVISRTTELREVGHLYQALCVDTWRANGFRVISVNAESEVGRIEALYPDVEIEIASRDLGATIGKPLIPLSEMIRVLRKYGSDAGGIVNSDVFVPPCEFAAWLGRTLGNADGSVAADCLFMNRQEIGHPTSAGGHPYIFGLDAFFFKMEAIEEIDCDPFAIGLPWWDYYLPMALLLAGRRLARVEGVPLLHLSHPQKWNAANWRLMFEAFRDRLGDQLLQLHEQRREELPTLAALVQEDRMVTYLTDHPVERAIDDPGFDAAQRYRDGYSLSVADLVYQLSGAARFEIETVG